MVCPEPPPDANQGNDADPGRLLGLASSGDPGAAQALFERYLPGLIAYVRRHAGGVVAAMESATDIAHSACREVLTKLATDRFAYRDEHHFRAWLFQSALRKIQDRGRHWARDKRDPSQLEAVGEVPAALLQGLCAAIGTPSQAAITREEREQVALALLQLDARQREIVLMSYEQGLTHREIAERLQIEESHSRTLLARALARLSRLVAS